MGLAETWTPFYITVLGLLWMSCLQATVVEKYIGCFKEGVLDSRELDVYIGWSTTMTAKHCIDRCMSNNFTFAALQRGDECWCGDSFGEFGAAATVHCRYNCIGDINQQCGGLDYSSIYSVCKRGVYGKRFCDLECECGGWFCHVLSGDCIGDCHPSNCSMEFNSTSGVTLPDHCGKANGGCSQGCQNTENGPHCFCFPGYVETPKDGACLDENECRTQNGNCQHFCTNTEGGRTCSCRAGFLNNSETSCTDECPRSFELTYPIARGVSSGCIAIDTIEKTNLTMCKQRACEQNRNTFTFRNTTCVLRHCQTSYLVTVSDGAWNVWSIQGNISLPTAKEGPARTTPKRVVTTPEPEVTTASHVAVVAEPTGGGFQMWYIAIIVVALIVIIAIVVFVVIKRRRARKAKSAEAMGNGHGPGWNTNGYDNYLGRAGKQDGRIVMTDGSDIDVVNKNSYPNLGQIGTVRNKTLHKEDTHYDEIMVAS